MMTFPAFFDLCNDASVVAHPTAIRVYARLIADPLIFYAPQAVKTKVLAMRLGVEERAVTRAFRLLIGGGYIVDHGRGPHRVRRIQVAMIRRQPGPNGGTQAAA